jgi:hypothetical protein
MKGGKVVSVTTDGFITDITDMESKLLALKPNKIPLLLLYRDLRYDLSESKDSLEVKH